ncbi:MAG: hypothetical protein QM778_23215 [Myxococcales bacterium]
MRARHLARILPLSLLLTGCGADLTQPWEVVGPHAYGSRIEVTNEPSRSMPRLGESFVLHEYVAGADELTVPLAERYDMKLTICVGFVAPNGTTVCVPLDKGIVDALESGITATVVNTNEIVTSPITLPSKEQILPFVDEQLLALFDQINQVALIGAVCVQGAVERVDGTSADKNPPTELFRCESQVGSIYKDPLVFLTTVFLDLEKDTPNHNPSFECDKDPAAQTNACNAGVVHELEEPGDAGARPQSADEPDISEPGGNEPDADAGALEDAAAPEAPEDAAVPGALPDAGTGGASQDAVPGAIVLVSPANKRDAKAPRTVQPWYPVFSPTKTDLPWTGCDDDPGLPMVKVGSGEWLVRVRVDASDREVYSYQAEEYGKPVMHETREEPFVTVGLTEHGGEIDHFTSVVSRDLDDAKAEIEAAYTAPKKNPSGAGNVPTNGRLVRFYFTLNDRRGGYAFATRDLCLVPKDHVSPASLEHP